MKIQLELTRDEYEKLIEATDLVYSTVRNNDAQTIMRWLSDSRYVDQVKIIKAAAFLARFAKENITGPKE
jgi:hypothetical protein